MQVLWDRSRATVADVHEALETEGKPAYNTVLTMLNILERKGYVMHEKDGRAFVYVPLVNDRQARRTALSHVLTRFFKGSPELLVLDLLGNDRPDEQQRQRIRELIERADETRSSEPPTPPPTRKGRS